MTKPKRIVWITGAGKGIGRAVAERHAGDGWTVCVSARTESDLESLRKECGEDRVHAYPLDVTKAEDVEHCIDRIEAEVGPIDRAIFNAGTHKAESLEEFSVDSTRKLVEVNLMGVINGLAPILARFRNRKAGHVAVVASLAGYRGLPTAASYGATKAALINLCEALKPDLDAAGIRISLINPGFVKTPLTDRNDFPMPFLTPVDDAARAICKGLESSRFEITVPRRFAAIMKILRVLPDTLFFALTRRMVR